MANILNNRVSATLVPEQITDVKNAFQVVREKMSFLVGLTNDERQTLPKMSVVNRGFTDAAIAAISNNPEMFPNYLNVDELRKDLQLYDQLDELLKISFQITELIRDTQILAGSEAYATALTGYKLSAAAATGGIPGAKSVYDALKKRFEGQGNFSTGTPEEPTTPTAPINN